MMQIWPAQYVLDMMLNVNKTVDLSEYVFVVYDKNFYVIRERDLHYEPA